jgi:hypothetical protein
MFNLYVLENVTKREIEVCKEGTAQSGSVAGGSLIISSSSSGSGSSSSSSSNNRSTVKC